MSKDRSTFTKTATTKAKNPRTWEITYTLVDGPAIKPKKVKKAAESEPTQADSDGTPNKGRSKRKKANESQQSLLIDR